jgi:hypothetical protein
VLGERFAGGVEDALSVEGGVLAQFPVVSLHAPIVA